jgi:hypothetical protein
MRPWRTVALLPLVAVCVSRPEKASDQQVADFGNAAAPIALPGEAPAPLAPTIVAPASTPAITTADAAPPAACQAFVKPGVITRAAMNRALDGGLGRWLRGVDVEARLEKGRFRGWTIRRLYPDDACYQDVDLRPGDVVVKVNGKRLERPEHANEIFMGLRSAPALTVDALRDGRPFTLTFAITND